ncbi:MULTISPECIES: LLM class F420-dependent oxidoreductase [unclassified Kitasatospora]|uniref:LLM class F420-dependent oxidoreductase n=1 Tax=unclassified Kitasatospora TaxID=2633591 RepID=UPI000708C84A|nr:MULTISPECIES: LLM class F420-dependent oxidoreductase [unclassified Kitasatospora]KQV19246.1 LLM class F420-dependent oxidoreductase [Kitasatospora sp. Root107]KRB77522.1 LLM class F420-dependent oxidoreductase [Kitasatospora sp. Root187]
MDLRILTEPQRGADYPTLLRVARHAEQLGFDGFFRSDHYLKVAPGAALPGPTDAWITLAGLARETSRITLGTMMTASTFRLPGVLAVQVAQVDQMSGGRIELGLGAGWFEREHLAYGIPFPTARFDRLEEQLEILTGMWDTPGGELFQYEGQHYRLVDCPALPKPVRGRVPVLIGGRGARRTPALAARFADEFNVPFGSPEDTGDQFRRVREAAEAAGRDPRTLVYSAALTVCVGRDGAEVTRRAAAIDRDEADLRATGLAGTPDEVLKTLDRYRAAGASRIYLQILDLADLGQLDLIADQVATQLP